VLLGGILATVRAGDRETLDDLTQTIRNKSGLPDLSHYVNGLMATWPDIYLEFQNIDFYLDDAPRRPSVETIENMNRRSSSAAADSISDEDMKDREEPDHTAQHQRVRNHEFGAKRSVIEPYSSAAAMNTREHTYGPAVDGNVDGNVDGEVDGSMQHSRPRGFSSISDGVSPRFNRRPWELP
jgi:hypothetical protein